MSSAPATPDPTAPIPDGYGSYQPNTKKGTSTGLIIGVVIAVVLVLCCLVGAGGFVVWRLSSSPDSKAAGPTASSTPSGRAQQSCTWTPDDPTANPNLKDVGTPPTGAPATKGTQTMTITLNVGVIEVAVDTAKAPCTAASMTYLAGKNFFDNSKCHRLVTEGIKVLQCGDPSGTGMGGPTYKMAEENLPNVTDPTKAYPAGVLAMAKTQQPTSTGSQFFIVYGETALSPDYTVLGMLTKGLDVVQQIAAAGAIGPDGKAATDGAPKTPVTITSLTMS